MCCDLHSVQLCGRIWILIMNLFDYINRQKRWSKQTFGDTPRTEGVLRHIEKEIQEVRDAPQDCEEWVDIIILALDGAWRAGFTPYEICQTMLRKQAKNMKRTYLKTPDDVPSEHIGDDEDDTEGFGLSCRFCDKILAFNQEKYYDWTMYRTDSVCVECFEKHTESDWGIGYHTIMKFIDLEDRVCPVARGIRYMRDTFDKNEYERIMTNVLLKIADSSTEFVIDTLKSEILTNMVTECNLTLDSFLTNDKEPPDNLVNLIEFLEWHDVPELRNEPEPELK